MIIVRQTFTGCINYLFNETNFKNNKNCYYCLQRITDSGKTKFCQCKVLILMYIQYKSVCKQKEKE